MPTTRKSAAARTSVLAIAILSAALVCDAGLASCSRSENHRVAADARDAARQTAAGLDHAAAQVRPVADRAARDAKRAADELAVAAGKATRKAGARLEHAGEHAQDGVPPPAESGSN